MIVTEYMCQEKKEEEELISIKKSVDASMQRLEDYIEKRWERLIRATRNNNDNTNTNRTTIVI